MQGYPNAKVIALTATATSLTRKTVINVLLMYNPHVIFESPGKPNVAYSVYYIPKGKSLKDYFQWLGDIFLDQTANKPRGVIIEMLHSCSPKANKAAILQAFRDENLSLRVLVATIAFGMGIDCKGV